MSDLDKITMREKEIAKLISDLEQEAGELAVARRVLLRLEPGQHQINLTAANLTVGDGKLGPKRPDGAPSTFAMTEGALSDAEVAGKDGLTGKELVDAIREKYWPGLQSGQILPIIYGFVRQGRLRKTPGGKFKRLKKAEE